MTDDRLISLNAAIDLIEEVENKRLKGEIDLTYAPMIKGINALPSAQPVEDAKAMCGECDAWNQYKNYLDEQPAVDVVQVRHGRWTDKDGGIATCSVCGDRWGVWSVMQYCPSCGARMDWKDGEQYV